MKHTFTKSQIVAIENLIAVAEQHYDTRRVVEADDIIVLNSARYLQGIVDKWNKQNDVQVQHQTQETGQG